MRPSDRERGWDGTAHGAHRVVVEGRVSCPRRGQVDVVDCFGCPWSLGLSGEHDERVVCVWQGQPVPDARD